MFDQEEFGSDTDDSDFVPEGEGHEVSEEEGSGDDEKAIHGENSDKKPSKKKKERKKAGVSSTFSRTPADNSTAEDWKKFENEVEKELKDKSEAERIDSLWSAFKSDVDKSKTTGTKPKPAEANDIKTDTDKPSENKSSNSTLVNSNPVSSSKPASRFSSLFDPTPLPSEEKSSTSATTSTSTSVTKPKSRFGSLFDVDNTESKPSESDSSDVKSDETKATSDKIAVTKVYDFAGEIVKVTKEVDANSKEAKKFLDSNNSTEEPPSVDEGTKRKVGGLASVVGSIGKKAKMGCLDKSKLDWNQFVQDEGIKEDLTTFNKGKEGYVEKQMFLERADVRQFEIEKAAREKSRKSFMK